MAKDTGKKLADMMYGQNPEQAAFGFFPHMKPRRARQDPEAAKNFPVDLARGAIAGVYGMPGDVESLVRLPYELITGKESPTILPTSEDILKRLPYGSDTPVGQFASGLGSLGGGFYVGPGSAAKAITAVPKAVKRASKDFMVAAGQSGPKIFVGPKSKTWHQGRADMAVAMEEAGRKPEEIWLATGTFRGADGILRQEIDDRAAKFLTPDERKEIVEGLKGQVSELKEKVRPSSQKDLFPKALTEARKEVKGKIGELKDEIQARGKNPSTQGLEAKYIFEHPELYKAYPELADLNITTGGGDRSSGTLGALSVIPKSGDRPGAMAMDIYHSGLSRDPTSISLHEMQHAVQTLEGMGPGGSPTMAFSDPIAQQILKRRLDEIRSPGTFEEFQRANRFPEDKAREAYEEYVRTYKPFINPKIEREVQKEAAMEYYRRLAGEAEARAVQDRQLMTPQQRMETPPAASYDVPMEDLIVKPPREYAEGGEVGNGNSKAAFGFFPHMRPRRSRQDPEAAKNFPVDLARGVVAGAVGLPGDIEALGRLPYELITGNESPTILPTSEDVLKRIPFGSETPVGGFASGLGALFGGSANLGAVPRAVKKSANAIVRSAIPSAPKVPSIAGIDEASISAPYRTQPTQPQGLTYDTAQEGPFYRVRPSLPQATGRQNIGTKEAAGQPQGFVGPTGGDVPQPITDEAVQQMMRTPDNFVRQAADQYSLKNVGEPYQLPEIPESSLLKQSPIGRVFGLAATDDPAYKKTVFDAYAKTYPDLVERSGAQNYDQLMEASYRQLAKETEQQFRSLPINMSYHRAGEGNYDNSKELLRDIYGNRHMYVYQGGDPHDFLNAVDPATGLNTNEMFRAVHDFFGHAIHGNQFGPKGEEIAWAAHSKMFSPLARIAMTSETRGQNSFVNYTPLNAALKAKINELNGQAYEARRRGQTGMLEEINKDLAEAWQQFQFAPQKSVILPPEFLDLNYRGGMPGYLQPLVKPEPGTTVSSQLTHFSKQPGLTQTDPRMYGTGIKGEEMMRLKDTPGAVTERTYFYAGDPMQITPEPGLGPYRYAAESSGLYDVAADPLKLRTLSAETQRMPYTSPVNPGMVTGSPFTDVERLAKEYGYEGILNPSLTKPTATIFQPKPVRPFAKGGPVHFSDNPDTMQLELAGGAVKKAAGGEITADDLILEERKL
jgi:hypothetical protein